MSLPKRDGVKGRYYLIHKPDTSPEVLAEADLCIQDVLDGTARENHSDYPTVVRNHNGTPFLPDQLLERYLSRLPLKGFPCEDAVSLCDAMRRLVCWEEIRYELEKYIEKQVQERFFLVGEREDGFTVFPPCTVCPSGMVGLETALAVALTYLYHTGEMALSDILRRMTINPACILRLPTKGRLAIGSDGDVVIFDPDEAWTVEPNRFASKGRNTPFGGKTLRGKVKYTIVGGEIVYREGE